MKCGFCNHTDGLCYTSNPPQVKCNITGKYHFYGSDCDALETPKTMKAIPCLICGEELSAELHESDAKVCEKCKEAVMKIRKNMEWDSYTPILD